MTLGVLTKEELQLFRQAELSSMRQGAFFFPYIKPSVGLVEKNYLIPDRGHPFYFTLTDEGAAFFNLLKGN